MACPKCGCKVTYEYCNGWDDEDHAEERQRCSACRHVFFIEDSADEDDDREETSSVPDGVPTVEGKSDA